MNKEVEFHFNRIKTVSVDTLKTMYSPLFDKRFHEMTDDEIKQQLDFWIENQYPKYKHIFEPRKPLTQEQREYNMRTFVRSRK